MNLNYSVVNSKRNNILGIDRHVYQNIVVLEPKSV